LACIDFEINAAQRVHLDLSHRVDLGDSANHEDSVGHQRIPSGSQAGLMSQACDQLSVRRLGYQQLIIDLSIGTRFPRRFLCDLFHVVRGDRAGQQNPIVVHCDADTAKLEMARTPQTVNDLLLHTSIA
jgi:hypothetical protein